MFFIDHLKKMKKSMLKNPKFFKTYMKVNRLFWKNYARMAPISATKLHYKRLMGKPLDFKNPKTLSEKLQYLKVYDYYKNPTVTQCADKYAVRDYVQNKGCAEILNDLYFAFDSVDEIDWDDLPNEFVLKCNHDSGGYIVCRDKSKFDIEQAKKKLRKWMKSEYGLEHVEFSYEGIKRKIICEKIIQSEDGGAPRDFKIFCSHGSPKFLYVNSERKEGTDEFALDYFTPEWEWIPVRNGSLPNAKNRMEKPRNLDLLLEYAKKLSEDFPIVRVDLYSEFGKITFGELTFLPTGGTFHLNPSEYDEKFGEMFPISVKKSRKKSHNRD